MSRETIPACLFCGPGNVRENKNVADGGPSVIGEYPAEEEHSMYKCLTCGREFDEREMEDGYE